MFSLIYYRAKLFELSQNTIFLATDLTKMSDVREVSVMMPMVVAAAAGDVCVKVTGVF